MYIVLDMSEGEKNPQGETLPVQTVIDVLAKAYEGAQNEYWQDKHSYELARTAFGQDEVSRTAANLKASEARIKTINDIVDKLGLRGQFTEAEKNLKIDKLSHHFGVNEWPRSNRRR